MIVNVAVTLLLVLTIYGMATYTVTYYNNFEKPGRDYRLECSDMTLVQRGRGCALAHMVADALGAAFEGTSTYTLGQLMTSYVVLIFTQDLVKATCVASLGSRGAQSWSKVTCWRYRWGPSFRGASQACIAPPRGLATSISFRQGLPDRKARQSTVPG